MPETAECSGATVKLTNEARRAGGHDQEGPAETWGNNQATGSIQYRRVIESVRSGSLGRITSDDDDLIPAVRENTKKVGKEMGPKYQETQNLKIINQISKHAHRWYIRWAACAFGGEVVVAVCGGVMNALVDFFDFHGGQTEHRATMHGPKL
jgi:hypothetical protein